MGLLTHLTATSTDDGYGGWVVRVVVGRAEGVAEGIDGLALQAESHVGVDAGGDADVGVAEEFLDHDEVDSLFQEQGRGRVSKVVEADATESGPAEEVGDTNSTVTHVFARGGQVVVPQASEAARGWFTAYFEAGGDPMEGLLGNLAASQARQRSSRPCWRRSTGSWRRPEAASVSRAGRGGEHRDVSGSAPAYAVGDGTGLVDWAGPLVEDWAGRWRRAGVRAHGPRPPARRWFLYGGRRGGSQV